MKNKVAKFNELFSKQPTALDRYIQGVELGAQQVAQDELSLLREAQVRKLLGEVETRRRLSDPMLTKHMMTAMNPDIAVGSEAFKEAATFIQGKDIRIWGKLIDFRNNLTEAKARQKNDVSDEVITAKLGQEIAESFGLPSTTFAGGEGLLTRGEAVKGALPLVRLNNQY